MSKTKSTPYAVTTTADAYKGHPTMRFVPTEGRPFGLGASKLRAILAADRAELQAFVDRALAARAAKAKTPKSKAPKNGAAKNGAAKGKADDLAAKIAMLESKLGTLCEALGA